VRLRMRSERMRQDACLLRHVDWSCGTDLLKVVSIRLFAAKAVPGILVLTGLSTGR
jgi:hypothetical protein